MPFVQVPNTVKVEMIQRIGGTVFENVHHYEADAPYIGDDMVALAAALAADWDTNWKSQFPNTHQLERIKLTSLESDTAPVVDYGVGMPIVSTNAGLALPMNCALVITKRTALRGRSYRGRSYIAPLTEANVTGDNVTPAWVSAIISRFNTINAMTVGLLTWQMVVVSYINNHIPWPAGVTTPVTSYTSDGVVDSQRRRLTGRGA